MANGCFVNSVAQVSCQKPLSDEWFDMPRRYTEKYVRSQEPDAKEILSAGEARRMGRLLKRAVCTSFRVLKESGISNPDAIVTGTGMGCMENSEKFLMDMSRFGEGCLKPTLFMQSTHNTISSLIAIIFKCHGYNNTYSHKGISFESALLDSWLQIKSGMMKNALVGSHDEATPFMSKIMESTHPEYSMISEASVSAVLTGETLSSNLCELSEVGIYYRPELSEIASQLEESDYLIVGTNGNDLNDIHYRKILEKLNNRPVILQYRNIFGDNFSSSALGFYTGVKILEQQRIPSHLYFDSADRSETERIENVTILNHSDGSAWSVIKLKRV